MEDLKKLETFENDHGFLSELLLMPNSNKTDPGRSNMFASNIVQMVTLDEPEIPIVFTNFENQVGKYSSAYYKTEEEFIVKHILEKSKLVRVIFLTSVSTGKVRSFTIEKYKHITENYGYKIDDMTSDFKIGDLLPTGTVLYRSRSYDENLNLMYGTNLMSAYLAWDGMTFEDAIVITEHAAQKLSHTTVKDIFVTINTNDVLADLYGTNGEIKSFPDEGETIKNRLLCARRRLAYESILVELSDSSLKTYKETDDLFQAEGTVVNIEVYCNRPKHLEDYEYNSQILKYYKRQSKNNKTITDLMDELNASNTPYCDDLGFMASRAKYSEDEEIFWTYNKVEFDVAVIKFTVANTIAAIEGTKISNRYGGKGVVSLIIPTEDAPVTDQGEIIHVIFNPLGVVNRLNFSQTFEHELNHLSSQLRYRMREMDNEARETLLFNYINDINPKQGEKYKEMYLQLSDDDKKEFMREIIKKGIPLHQPPFWDNISLATYTKLCKDYKISRKKLTQNIEKPQLVGEMYLIKLKHEPYSKFSARSAKQVSMKDIPVKNNNDYKNSQSLYSSTPIRIGEQEIINLLTLNNSEEVFRYIKMMSSNSEDRKTAIETLLTHPNIYNVEEIKSSNSVTKTSTILEAYMNTLGVSLKK